MVGWTSITIHSEFRTENMAVAHGSLAEDHLSHLQILRSRPKASQSIFPLGSSIWGSTPGTSQEQLVVLCIWDDEEEKGWKVCGRWLWSLRSLIQDPNIKTLCAHRPWINASIGEERGAPPPNCPQRWTSLQQPQTVQCQRPLYWQHKYYQISRPILSGIKANDSKPPPTYSCWLLN